MRNYYWVNLNNITHFATAPVNKEYIQIFFQSWNANLWQLNISNWDFESILSYFSNLNKQNLLFVEEDGNWIYKLI